MPLLLVVNGPPGIGKSTVARRYVEEHPLSLALEQDLVRHLLGGWESRETESGSLARELCLAMARTHLLGGHDVVVPQFVAVPQYLDRLAQVAGETACRYVECVLDADRDAAERRFHGRAEDPSAAEHQRVAAHFVAEAGGYQVQYDRLAQGLAGRPVTRIRARDGDVDGTYAAVLALVG